MRWKHNRGVEWFYPGLGGREDWRKFHRRVDIELDLKNKESSSVQSRRRRSEKEVSWSRGLEADKRAGSRKVWYLA